MKLKEKNNLVKWVNTLTDKELKNEYYEAVYYSLGSQTDKMYELGYDMKDIKEQEGYEKYLCEKADILENICVERGIGLWEEDEEKMKVDKEMVEKKTWKEFRDAGFLW